MSARRRSFTAATAAPRVQVESVKELQEIRKLIAKHRASESQETRALTARSQRDTMQKLKSFRADLVRCAWHVVLGFPFSGTTCHVSP